ncbi:MAG: Hsp20/alpha crystallin family protein [Candidatus Anstonellales archaeon]
MFFDPFEYIERMRKHFDKLFKNKEVGIFTIAPVNAYKDGSNVVYEFHMPGFRKDEIKISLYDGIIHVKAEKKSDIKKHGKEKSKEYFYEERAITKMERKLPIPDGAILEKISAEYKDGILKLVVPIKTSKNKKDISIK